MDQPPEVRERSRIAREGYPFLVVFFGAAAVASYFGFHLSALLPMGLGLFTLFFFRDPARKIPDEEGILVSPADGRVVEVTDTFGDAEGPLAGYRRVAIFLSVFNVHVNRAPVSGTVVSVIYTPGRYLAAYRQEASTVNERNRVELRSSEGNGDETVTFTQIAGLIARRIVCSVKEGERVGRGARVGLIRFGSRTELLVPPRYRPTVAPGDKVRGGSSVMAKRITENRTGEAADSGGESP